jgi:N-acetylmuramoyl-L-alanine amidase
VGLVVFLGCFTFVIAPELDRTPQREKILPTSDALPTVVIDPGHGGNDEGTKFYHLAEKDVTLDLAQRLEKTLRSLKFSTVLTRRDDHYVALCDRVAVANKIENVIFISLHFNSSSSGIYSGVETFYADQKLPPSQDWTWMGIFSRADQPQLDNGETLAGFVQAALVTKLNAANRGIRGRPLYVVRHTRAPAVLVEGGFISNPLENQLLRNDEYKQRMANAIAEGIVNYERTVRQSLPTPKLASSQSPVNPRKD